MSQGEQSANEAELTCAELGVDEANSDAAPKRRQSSPSHPSSSHLLTISLTQSQTTFDSGTSNAQSKILLSKPPEVSFSTSHETCSNARTMHREQNVANHTWLISPLSWRNIQHKRAYCPTFSTLVPRDPKHTYVRCSGFQSRLVLFLSDCPPPSHTKLAPTLVHGEQNAGNYSVFF